MVRSWNTSATLQVLCNELYSDDKKRSKSEQFSTHTITYVLVDQHLSICTKHWVTYHWNRTALELGHAPPELSYNTS